MVHEDQCVSALWAGVVLQGCGEGVEVWEVQESVLGQTTRYVYDYAWAYGSSEEDLNTVPPTPLRARGFEQRLAL